jgi:hypothetical protein
MSAAAGAGTKRRGSRPSSLEVFDRWWWLPVAALVPFFVYLNADASNMQLLYGSYICFRRVILRGLDPGANPCQSPTFPMWGYGWLLVITRTKAALLVFQGLAGLAAAWFFLRVLSREGLLGGWALRVSKLLLLVCIPWYAFHALRWPYSEASTLVVLSVTVLCLVLGRKAPSFGLTALSGILLGLALNFRSDYILLPLVVALAVIFTCRGSRRLQLQRLGVWLAAVVVALVPWMVYSARATGHVLLTSTNAGHVLYISLGQLPGNPWGITPSDSDPRMQRELEAHFHRASASSLTYASDQYLRHRFIQLVREHPGAWLQKDVDNARDTVTQGFYSGEFDRRRDGWLRKVLQDVSGVEGRLLASAGFILALALLGVSLRRRDAILAVITLVVGFQLAINTFAFYLSSYSSNVIVFTIALVGIAIAELLRNGQGLDCQRQRVTM